MQKATELVSPWTDELLPITCRCVGWDVARQGSIAVESQPWRVSAFLHTEEQTPALAGNVEWPVSLIWTYWQEAKEHAQKMETPEEKSWKFFTREQRPHSADVSLRIRASHKRTLLLLLFISAYRAAILGSVMASERWRARSTVTAAMTQCTWVINTREQSWRTSKNGLPSCADRKLNVLVCFLLQAWKHRILS